MRDPAPHHDGLSSTPQPASSRWREGAIWLVVAAILTWQFATNGLGVSDVRTFASFQRDSEAHVIGKMVSERVSIPFPAHGSGVETANLGLAWVEGVPPNYDIGVWTVLQGYELLSANQALPELRLMRAEFSADGWAEGVATAVAGIAVIADSRSIPRYIGRPVRVDGEPRFLRSVAVQGDVALLRLSGPPLAAQQPSAPRDVVLTGEPPSREVLRFKPYTSQYGLQGMGFTKLGQAGISLDAMYLITAGLFGAVLASLALVYARLFGVLFGIAFLATLLLSPWITNYGRNLYWVPFTWFLPACLLGIGLLARSVPARSIAAVGYFLAVLLKCLCGYEYISTVILFASAPCIVAIVASVRAIPVRVAAWWLAGSCALGATAFFIALVLQAPMKAPTVSQGLAAIIEQDAVRRTHGDPGAFATDGDAVSSLSQSTSSVLSRYLIGWRTQLVAGVPGSAFAYLLAAAALIALTRATLAKGDRWRYAVMLAAFVVPAISWYVLGKGHSARHYHMNYVLWYMGAVPVCAWICMSPLVDMIRQRVRTRPHPVTEVPDPVERGVRRGARRAKGRRSRD